MKKKKIKFGNRRMTVIEAIRKELDSIENNPELKNSMPFLREDFGALMLAVMFKDGKIHYILPSRDIVMHFVDDLVNMLRAGDVGWKMAQNNFEKQKMEPLIDEGEMEL